MLTDIEIAQQAELKPIKTIAENLNIKEEELEPYGRYKAKLSDSLMERLKDKPDGKLVLVTAINPTPAAEPQAAVTRRFSRWRISTFTSRAICTL